MSTTRTRPVRRLIAAAALLVTPLASLLPSPDASAVDTTTVMGSAGSFETNGPMIIAVGSSPSTLAFASAGLDVGLHPAGSDRQVVKVQYAAEYWFAGYWVSFANTETKTGEATGEATATFPSWTVGRPRDVSSAKEYRIVYTVTWQDAATGKVLGSVLVTPSAEGDALCATDGLACSTLDTGVFV